MEMDKSYNGEMENVLTKTISYYTYCQNSYIQRLLKKNNARKRYLWPLIREEKVAKF